MTYKEALREVATLSESRVRYLHATTDDAGLRRVCGWYLNERAAFDELVELAGRPAPDEYVPAVKGRPLGGRTNALVDFYLTWTTHRAAAQAFNMPYHKMPDRIRKAATARGLVLARQLTPDGLRWRVVPPSVSA